MFEHKQTNKQTKKHKTKKNKNKNKKNGHAKSRKKPNLAKM